MSEIGIPPVLIAKDKFCEECNSVHDFEKCPKCGAWIDINHGLMGGGYGLYKICQNENCDWFWKRFYVE